jgi:uncharacterized phage infection (PIP) family protein YhgE
MEEIVSSVKRVTDIMAEIAAASEEQTSGIEQVNQAIVQMDQMTQQNAALVEEAAAAAESMQQQAQSLTSAVSIFRLSGRPEAHTPAPAKTNNPAVHASARPSSPPRQEEPWNGHSERRGPNRARNVARLPVAPAVSDEGSDTQSVDFKKEHALESRSGEAGDPAPAFKAAASAPRTGSAAKAHDDGDWQEF